MSFRGAEPICSVCRACPEGTEGIRISGFVLGLGEQPEIVIGLRPIMLGPKANARQVWPKTPRLGLGLAMTAFITTLSWKL